MKTLKHLQDYFSTTDNAHVIHKLDLLEIEIENEIIKARIEESDKHLKTLKTI